MNYLWLIMGAITFILASLVEGYPYDIPVHKRIVVEAAKIWLDTPQEIRDHLSGENKLDLICSADYDVGDDIFVGSGEEDNESSMAYFFLPQCPDSEHIATNEGRNGVLEHFWNPDFPKLTPSGLDQRGYNCKPEKGLYNLGLPDLSPVVTPACGDHFDSAYQLAQDYWDNKVIPFYKSGRIGEAYYWLGRVAHLLSDLGVPAHVHLTPHDPVIGSKDLYEDFVRASIVRKYPGDNFKGQEYRVECFPNLPCDFDWTQLHPNPTNFFKLFWYTAQKTNYWASKNKRTDLGGIGNDFYLTLEEEGRRFMPSLWESEATPISDPNDLVGRWLQQMADALIPHTLKSVAGLYRLFWMEVNAPDCEAPQVGMLTYLCFVTGNPGVPGDGVIVSVPPEEFGDFYFATPISLARVKKGLSLNVYPKTDSTLVDGWNITTGWVIRGRPGCEVGTQQDAILTSPINGIRGYSIIEPQSMIKIRLDIIKGSPGCANVTMEELELTFVSLFNVIPRPILFVLELDAVSIEIFPEEAIPE